MREDGKIKVVWLCTFSNYKIRDTIQFSKTYYKYLVSKVLKRPKPIVRDRCVWVTNAIQEFEGYDDVDLTVVFPYWGIKGKLQHFDIKNIHYICFKSEDDNLIDYYRIHRNGYVKKNWTKNRRIISEIISRVNPDLIHIIGAENPNYSIAALDIPSSIPCVTSLQTLMSAPDFRSNYPISDALYNYRSELEKQVVKRSDYIATQNETFISIIKRSIKPDALFLRMILAVGENVNTDYDTKDYDFVYFAADIIKASDYAIEAFALACKRYPKLTLNISGGYSQGYKSQLDKRIQELGIKENVFFTGPKETHEEVLQQIKKSRFALLPLKVDLISGTIREAMACGLPVVTTITPETPDLNRNRESILLSEIGDYASMAENMIKLLNSEEYALQIRENAIKTIQETYNTKKFMQNWRIAYSEILRHFKYGTPFSDDILIK